MVRSSMPHPQEWKKDSIAMDFLMPRDRASVPSSLVTIYLAAAGTAYLLGILTHGLIIVVHLCDWAKGRRLMPNAEILSSLVLSNLCNSTLITAEYVCSLIWDDFYCISYNIQRVFSSLDISTSSLSFWFAAWLSVFYCMKIVSFKQPCLVKMKLKFPGLVRWLLFGSTVVSLGAGFLFQLTFKESSHRKQGTDSTNQTTSLPPASNCTYGHVNTKTVLVQMSPSYRVLIIIVGCSIPLLVVVFSSVLVLFSLFQHTQKMEQTLSPSHLEAHVKAAKTVLSLLVCYVIWVVCQMLVRAEIYRNWYYQYFLCLMAQLAIVLAQSTILIRSNPRLNEVATQLLSCWLGRHRNENSRGSTELQEV